MSAGDFTQNLQLRQNAGKASIFNPRLRRFVEPDTLIANEFTPQRLNRYSYTFNSPINYSDPSGRDPWWCEEDTVCLKKNVSSNSSQLIQSALRTHIYYNLDRLDGHNRLITPGRISRSTSLAVRTSRGFVTHGHHGCGSNPACGPSIGSMPYAEGAIIDFGDGSRSVNIEFGNSTTVRDHSPNHLFNLVSGNGYGIDQAFVEAEFSGGSPAPLADIETIMSLSPGDIVQVVYWDDEQDGFAIANLEIDDPVNEPNFINSIRVIDALDVINPGDSGGGVFYNGELVGTISGQGPGHATFTTLYQP